MAATDPSALVRLYLASAMQRTAPEQRWQTLEALMQHTEDKEDHNLPLMLWYAFEPTIPTDINRAVDLALKAEVPHILPFTVQRVGAIGSQEAVKALQRLQQSLQKIEPSHFSHELQNLIKKQLVQK